MNVKLTEEICTAKKQTREEIKKGIESGAIKGLIEPAPSRTTWIDGSEIPATSVKSDVSTPETKNPEIIKLEKETELIKAKTEKAVAESGYTSLEDAVEGYQQKLKTVDDGEAELVKALDNFEKEKQKFQEEQTFRVNQANTKLAEAKSAKELFETKSKDAETKMAEAQELASKAEAIIKAQTESQKKDQKETDVYEEGKNDISKFLQIAGNSLMKFGKSIGNGNVSKTGGEIYNYGCDVYDAIIGSKDKDDVKSTVEKAIDKINEQCQYIQDKNSNPELLEKLGQISDTLMEICSIKWKPALGISVISAPQCQKCKGYRVTPELLNDKVINRCEDCGAIVTNKEKLDGKNK
jgi:chromosome segregation ATPase